MKLKLDIIRFTKEVSNLGAPPKTNVPKSQRTNDDNLLGPSTTIKYEKIKGRC
jgi:hypothetical protein